MTDAGLEKSCHCPTERKFVGKVTPQERDEVQSLFERKNGLTELIASLAAEDHELLKNDFFYEKVVADLGRTVSKQQNWWDLRARQYGWENVVGCVWEIDFESCRIFLRPR